MDIADQLVLTGEADAVGRKRDLYRAQSRGDVVQLRRGVFVTASALDGARAQQKYELRVRAAMAVRQGAVATSVSATVLLGLPLYGAEPERVYLLSPTGFSRSRNGVLELPRLGTEEVVSRDGALVTGLPFSIVQACRHTPFMTALTIVERAVHVDRFGKLAPLCTLESLWAIYNELLPFARSARVRAVLNYATVFADTPLETVSRATIDDLGFPEPLQQHELWLPRLGQRAFLDFAWPDYRVAGEADGWGKYLDPHMGPQLDPFARLQREKRRDDAIRELSWTPAHWEWADVQQRERLAAILRAAGLPQRRRARVIR